MDERKRQKALRDGMQGQETKRTAAALPGTAQTEDVRRMQDVLLRLLRPRAGEERHQWCRHVSADGCSLHDKERPSVCTDFACLWLAHPEVPERFRPDRIGCVAIELGNRVVVVCQTYKGAAKRQDASWFIDCLVDAGTGSLSPGKRARS